MKRVNPYKINDFLVAEKPIIETIYADKNFYAVISMAEHDGRWGYGYKTAVQGSLTGCSISSCSPSFSKNVASFSSKNDARLAALKYLMQSFKKQEKHPNGTPVSKVMHAINSNINQQLVLNI